MPRTQAAPISDVYNTSADLIGRFTYHYGNDLRGVAVSNKVAVLGATSRISNLTNDTWFNLGNRDRWLFSAEKLWDFFGFLRFSSVFLIQIEDPQVLESRFCATRRSRKAIHNDGLLGAGKYYSMISGMTLAESVPRN
jgi:hypothetical protein